MAGLVRSLFIPEACSQVWIALDCFYLLINGPCNSGFKTGARQNCWSGFEKRTVSGCDLAPRAGTVLLNKPNLLAPVTLSALQ